MAINMNTGDSSACSSTRISFSQDLPEANAPENQEEVEVIRLDKSLLLDSSSDFNFCVTTTYKEDETSPADELFFNGVIIPIQMKLKLDLIDGFSAMEEEEITATTTATLVREEKANQSKSFWRFGRSSSLNCENYGDKKSSIWSLPSLFRSKSTGSSLLPNSSQDHRKQRNKNASSNNNTDKLVHSNSGSRSSFFSHQKPPLRKSGSTGGNGSAYPVNGVKNVHVLNVPSPYIVKGTSDLLGLSSLFRNGPKEKKSKK